MSKLFRAGRIAVREPVNIPLAELPLPQREEEPDEAAEAARQAALAQAAQIRTEAARDAGALYAGARQAAAAEGRRLGAARAESAAQAELSRLEAEHARRLSLCRAQQAESLAACRGEARRQVMELAAALAGHILRTRVDSRAPRFFRLAEETLGGADAAPQRALRPAGRPPVPKGDDAVA